MYVTLYIIKKFVKSNSSLQRRNSEEVEGRFVWLQWSLAPCQGARHKTVGARGEGNDDKTGLQRRQKGRLMFITCHDPALPPCLAAARDLLHRQSVRGPRSSPAPPRALQWEQTQAIPTLHPYHTLETVT